MQARRDKHTGPAGFLACFVTSGVGYRYRESCFLHRKLEGGWRGRLANCLRAPFCSGVRDRGYIDRGKPRTGPSEKSVGHANGWHGLHTIARSFGAGKPQSCDHQHSRGMKGGTARRSCRSRRWPLGAHGQIEPERSVESACASLRRSWATPLARATTKHAWSSRPPVSRLASNPLLAPHRCGVARSLVIYDQTPGCMLAGDHFGGWRFARSPPEPANQPNHIQPKAGASPACGQSLAVSALPCLGPAAPAWAGRIASLSSLNGRRLVKHSWIGSSPRYRRAAPVGEVFSSSCGRSTGVFPREPQPRSGPQRIWHGG